jgi:hypothetical protein
VSSKAAKRTRRSCKGQGGAAKDKGGGRAAKERVELQRTKVKVELQRTRSARGGAAKDKVELQRTKVDEGYGKNSPVLLMLDSETIKE